MKAKLVNRCDARKKQPLIKVKKVVVLNDDIVGLGIEYSFRGVNGFSWLKQGSPNFDNTTEYEVEDV